MNAGHLLNRVKTGSRSKWRWVKGERGSVSGVLIRCLLNSHVAFPVGQAFSDLSQQVCPVRSQHRDEGTDQERRQSISNVHDLSQGAC